MKQKTVSSTNEIIFTLDRKIYTKEVIFRACRAFTDRAYIYLDYPTKNKIEVSLKRKGKSDQKQLESLKNDFLNELLNVLTRKEIAAKNQKILEYIVGEATIAALEKPGAVHEIRNPRTKKIKEEAEALMKELEAEAGDYQKDPLGIKKVNEES